MKTKVTPPPDVQAEIKAQLDSLSNVMDQVFATVDALTKLSAAFTKYADAGYVPEAQANALAYACSLTRATFHLLEEVEELSRDSYAIDAAFELQQKTK